MVAYLTFSAICALSAVFMAVVMSEVLLTGRMRQVRAEAFWRISRSRRAESARQNTRTSPGLRWMGGETVLAPEAALPLWVNKDLSATVFGGKQNNSFWQTVFETGRSPQGVQVLAKPLNLVEMIK